MDQWQRMIEIDTGEVPPRRIWISATTTELQFVRFGNAPLSPPRVYVATGRRTTDGLEIWAPRSDAHTAATEE